MPVVFDRPRLGAQISTTNKAVTASGIPAKINTASPALIKVPGSSPSSLLVKLKDGAILVQLNSSVLNAADIAVRIFIGGSVSS